MFVKLEGQVMEALPKTFEGKTSMQVAVHQKGSVVLDIVKMSVDEYSALNLKEGSLFSGKVSVNAYKDNQGNARLSCKYMKN
jgi:hypothetical protein